MGMIARVENDQPPTKSSGTQNWTVTLREIETPSGDLRKTAGGFWLFGNAKSRIRRVLKICSITFLDLTQLRERRSNLSKKSKADIGTIEIVEELISLLKNFQSLSADTELRQRVQALVPALTSFQLLGPSLLPAELRTEARKRLLYYLQQYPFTILPRKELEIVAGIGEWARRLRELRVQFGWQIVSGAMAKAMAAEEELDHSQLDIEKMRVDDYMLLSMNQDKSAAHRWNTAKVIRQGKGSVTSKILAYLQENVGVPVSGEELRYVAGDATEWARRTRDLRTMFGWPVVTKQSGRPDMPIGTYMLEQNRQSPEHDRNIPVGVRRKTLRRDEYRCRRCGWNHELDNRSDPRHLEPHHIRKHAQGGENTEENLITLCTVCHDEWHAVESKIGEEGFHAWVEKGI